MWFCFTPISKIRNVSYPVSQVKWIPCSRLTTLPVTPDNPPILEGFGKPVSYVPLGKNRGIAEAQNIGIDLSIKEEYSHVLLLDQDSALSSGMVNKLLAAEEELLGKGEK